jgi:hypothetical protein
LKATHEHEFEAAPGLPEPLPSDEAILWQGAPDALALALRVYHLRQLAGYFLAMLVLQGLYVGASSVPVLVRSLSISLVMAVIALALLGTVAWLSARATLYTLTNKRVVMRIGIVLTLTLNLPLRRMAAASVRAYSGGAGDIAIDLAGDDRIGWLHIWPHARPWTLKKPQPSLRCVPKVHEVAALIQATWRAANPGVEAQFGEVRAGNESAPQATGGFNAIPT